jgi:hypothetical protein
MNFNTSPPGIDLDEQSGTVGVAVLLSGWRWPLDVAFAALNTSRKRVLKLLRHFAKAVCGSG